MVSVWRIPDGLCVVWCRDSATSSRVSRWNFSRPYATTERENHLVERAFLIPAQREGWARRQLGLPKIGRAPTANQRAYYERLRNGLGRSSLRESRVSREAHGRRYSGEESARSGVKQGAVQR